MKTIPKMTSPRLENALWHLEIHPHTGALARLGHPADPHGMNWISDSAENPTVLDSHGWGLGFLAVPGGNGPQRWQRPEEVTLEENCSRARYWVGAIEVTITRRLHGDRFDETFEFHNPGASEEVIWGIGLYTPFNDNYPDAATCVTRRCNAHLWCGGNTAYACCLRMGGVGPHLGLILTEGFIGGYSIEGRGRMLGSSNLRGSIVFNANGLTLQPGQTHRIAWTCFWHQGWEDFFAQARAIPGFIEVKSERYTYVTGQPPAVTVSDPTANIEPLTNATGEQTVKIHYGEGRETWLCLNAVDDLDTLIRRRTAFIRDRQQVRDRRHPLYGAFITYDNELGVPVLTPDAAGQSEGAERIGMGVLLAQSLQCWPDLKTEKAARLYQRFVRSKLQRPDGTVLAGVRDATERFYNYPWVAQLHLEMYRALDERRFLLDCCQTLRTYYAHGGVQFYAINIPMVDTLAACEKAGLTRETAQLRQCFLAHGDHILATGLNIPPHEVNYEQTIIGPAVAIVLDCYHISSQPRYLEQVQPLLAALEAFGGRQPDHHLHEIAIRHWDGYWFGGREMWGDTFPHYWSALTGWVFLRYWQATGDESYRRRGREILMNNLSAFRADGSARAIYIYPDAVNGNPMRRWDPLANDQDWALVFLMQAARLDSDLSFPEAGSKRHE
jgi:hypothetical protein